MTQTPRRGTSRWLKLAAGALLAAVVAVIIQVAYVGRIAEPAHTVVSTEGNIEIRDYAPMIVAEVETEGERIPAINSGFRLLADYIFGNNISQQKIDMTIPVTQSPNEKIAMTAPVTQQGDGNLWKVRFVMPSSYTLETLPKPRNEQVKIIAEKPQRFAVVRFSGRTTDHNLSENRNKLLAFLKAQNLVPAGELIYAFYNPPWTLPFLKRTEVMVPLAS
jgi:DNA gyrase inhibitor GyrI